MPLPCLRNKRGDETGLCSTPPVTCTYLEIIVIENTIRWSYKSWLPNYTNDMVDVESTLSNKLSVLNLIKAKRDEMKMLRQIPNDLRVFHCGIPKIWDWK